MIISERICVIGSGYVGLTTGVCLASLGHSVTCVDRDSTTVAELREARTFLAEPDLTGLLRHGLETNALRFDTTAEAAAAASAVVFLCLPTPPGADGSADLTAIEQTVRRIRKLLRPSAVLVTKSTVPVGTADNIRTWLDREDIAVVSNPEFLREGHAVYDFLHPTRILIGSNEPVAAKRVAALYDAVRAEVIVTDPATAELSKYAANSFLATKLSYINTVAEVCEAVGADITDLTHVLGTDPRIGADFLSPGPGWGGPCLPKDTRALLRQADHAGVDFPVLAAAIASNIHHRGRMIARLRDELGRNLSGARIGVLGLTFKTGTNDLRDSPASHVVRALTGFGATVAAHDPTVHHEIPGVEVKTDVYEVVPGIDGLILITDWPEYHSLDWNRIAGMMVGDLVLDTRNAFARRHLAAAGLRCVSLGRRSA
ncbi:UDP-glucose/GDP-mannose dehydrogenase family protein [Amycolatopsis rubida]|uniref:UDP-glucose 6-dehydrogenase n=1 Tax=Amycolatopsis rubida TaxID=112413 RepID=A0ABX0BV79_9PSEU|nr:UDP-glucose/GDP-mannose dehydrogenase family protein [Amycolatopsis sp. M39]MYW91711.1 nucleotide sugar dehydrogenase [Amycolatopsis rubida]NEC56695.1 UDP-glucose/GDP-mannose dehydrogenase family protein [Amycolatopsis rubida]OAP20411.1 UDP-glucose 6-dehydrogenase YwqF [Amycolatopsis sp. M39]